MRRIAPLALVCLLAVTACGGSAATVAPPAAAPATTGPAATDAPAAPTQPPAETPTDAPASMTPGAIAYRVANLTAGPVDVYVRTQGLVQALPAATGVAPGALTDDLFPPDPGSVVVLPAGGTDPTCVSGCTFLAESSTAFGDGDRRLLVVRDDGATEYWENPAPASAGTSSNALPPADPAQALLIAEAQGVTDGSFGMRVAYAGAAGCQLDTAGIASLLGGTVVATYAMDPPGTDVVVHDSSDQDCSAAPVGGPFPVTGAIGSRTFLLLWGTLGAMQGLAVPLP
jgi:hypothetical protein